LAEYIKSKSGVSGLFPGFLYKVTGWIDESENIFRYPNGQVIAEDDSIKGLTAFLDKQEKLGNTSIFCTETEWQAIKSASKFSQCGKYVRDKDAGTIRLPLIINEQGLNDLASCSVIKSESLPNITGSFRDAAIISNADDTDINNIRRSGAFNSSTGYCLKAVPSTITVNSWAREAFMNFNASNSSSTYQDNVPVQQEAIQYPYVICVNSGVEEAERPINNYQVNNVYSYGVSQYYKGEMDNLSWLKSEGQWNPGTVYNGVYEWALAKLNSGANDFKASTATDITDYDWVIDTANQTFRLPLTNGQRAIVKKFISDDLTYLIYNDGWYTQQGTGVIPMLTANTVDQTTIQIERTMANANYVVKVSTANDAGNTWDLTQYKLNRSTTSFTVGFASRLNLSGTGVFMYSLEGQLAEGQWNKIPLYYYVGDTLQNPDLINIARQQEQIVGKVSKSGDTMTGSLKINDIPRISATDNSTTPLVIYQKKASDFGATTYSNIVFRNANDENVAIIGGVEQTDGFHRIRLLRKDGSNWVEMPQIIYPYRNGKSGFNLYTNGYCEQWGYINSGAGSDTYYNFLLPFSGDNFNIGYSIATTENHTRYTGQMALRAWDVNGFHAMNLGGFGAYWIARGYVT